ncbi:MAG: serine dehydratase [Candidatus Marinimicrobia bacterium]|nr:serine dehydratase [Candidatus Neomarinimicrobiota bacterium]|tara:strand:- start:627 stop:1565 length:939 start_codon:yes stop_codon:yes gene_type:complete
MVNFNHIKSAHDRISNFIHNTPVFTCENINEETKSSIFFKCDNFQKTGSFKIRGATNKILQLSKEQLENGVITTSSGNHGAALASAAKKLDTSVKVIMPDNTPKVKVDNVERYGGEIIFCEPNIKARENTLNKMVKETGYTVVHPYNDKNIIAGQGTAAKELLEKIPDLDIIIAPVSGGGLLAGTLLTAKTINTNIKVYGAEPKNADDTYQSIKSKKIIPNKTTDTIADGLRAQVGTITFPIILKHVDEIILVSEEMIIQSMKMIWQRMKIIIEPSCSIVLAAILSNKKKFYNKRIGLILTGGNVDMDTLPW